MKPNSRLRNFLALSGGLFLASSAANAQLLWDANNTGAAQTDGAGTWTGANQWWNGAANVTWNSVTPDSANIGNGGAGGAISLGGNVTAGTIAFGNHTGTYTIQGTAQTLTVNTGITINTNSNVTFRGTGTSPNILTLTGTGGLTMNGTGVVIMRENITTSYTGTTTINSGVLLLNGGSKPTGNFYLNGGMLTDYFTGTGVFSSGLGTGANQIRIHGASGFGAGNGTSTWRIGATGSTLVWGASGEGTATGHFNPTQFKLRNSVADNNGPSIFGTPNIDNRLDLNSGSRTFNVHLGSSNIGGSRATIASGIQDTGAAGILNLTGGGMLVIGGTSATWGGATNINSGILFLGGNSEANIGGGSARNITIASGAGIQFNALNNATLNRIVETTDTIMVMTGGTINNFDFSSSTGANLPNAWLGNFATNGAKAEIGDTTAGTGVITPGSNGYLLGATGSSGLLGFVGTNKLTGANNLTVGQTGASGIRVELAGANNFTGNTVINTGAKLTLGNNLALQNSVLNLGSAGGTFALHAAFAAGHITGANTTASPTFGGLSGSRTLTSAFSVTAGNNETLLAATAVTGFTLNTGTGVNVTYTGAIGGFGTGASGGLNGASTLTKTGSGTQALGGASTYTGGTTISDGKLIAQGNNAALGTGSVSVANIATLQLNNNLAADATLAIANAITGAGTLEITASDAPQTTDRNRVTVGSLSSFTGNISVLANGMYGAFTADNTTNQNLTIASGGYMAIGTTMNVGFGKLDGGGTIIRNVGGVSTSTLTLGNNNATGGVFSGAIEGASTVGNSGTFNSSGLISVIKVGTGTQTLSGTNTYTGTTTVTAGTLLINGSTSTGVLTVDSGATLGGSGTVGGATTISGVHSPGNSPGLITHSGNLTYETGASVLWELVANATTVRGTDFDGINVGGVLDFNGSTTLNLNFQSGASAVEWSDTFWASSYTGTGGWLVYSGATSLDGFGNLALNLPAAWLDENGDTLASARAGSSFSLFQDTNNIYLNYSVIPEPNVAALIGALGGILLLRRRR